MGDWSPDSWRARAAAQQPDWPDTDALDTVIDELRALPPLVFAGEARTLTAALAEAAEGRAFVLQAGDCAESFDVFSANPIRDKLKIILQMAVVLTYGSGVPSVKIGRIAGQFAKPRSSPTETRDGVELPSFRGDMVNDFAFDADARTADPTRLLRVYHQSASTLNLLPRVREGRVRRPLARARVEPRVPRREPGGAALRRPRRRDRPGPAVHGRVRDRPRRRAQAARGRLLHVARSPDPRLRGGAHARSDTLTGDWYDCSAHLVWIGERTRQLDGAHVEFHARHQEPGRA